MRFSVVFLRMISERAARWICLLGYFLIGCEWGFFWGDFVFNEVDGLRLSFDKLYLFCCQPTGKRVFLVFIDVFLSKIKLV